MDAIDQSAPLVPLPRSSDFDVDLSTFSAATWLNQVISSSSASTSGFASISTPDLSSLQEALNDALREAHESLDVSLRDALKAVPWVVRESDRVRQRTKALRNDVESVSVRVAGVETGVASSVKTIADADTVVRRVQKAAALLETAASADILLERLESLLASAGVDGADLVTAADVAAQLRNALAPLRDVDQLKQRFQQLDQADKRLETLAAPQLRRALDDRDAQAAVNARIVFDHAGRQNAFRAQYVALRRKQVCTLWSDAWVSHLQQQQRQRAIESSGKDLDTDDGDNDGGNDDQGLSKFSNTASKVTSNTTISSLVTSGDFASEGADIVLRTFYDAVIALVATEAQWLDPVFPDVKANLLPALLCGSFESLSDPTPRATVFINPSVTDAVHVADTIADRLFTVADISVTAAARIAETLMPVDDNEETKETTYGYDIHVDDAKKDVDNTGRATTDTEYAENGDKDKVKMRDTDKDVNAMAVFDAVSALLMPWRMFWNALIQVSVRQGRTRAEAIQLSSSSTGGNYKFNIPLGDIARDVEVCTGEACAALDTVVNFVTSRSCGIGVAAMKQTAASICAVVSERIRKALPKRSSSGRRAGDGASEDEWTRLGGALRLLVATSALKRAWDARKEAAFAVAVGAATPVLELAGALQMMSTDSNSATDKSNNDNIKKKRVRQLIAHVAAGQKVEAGIVWQLGKDQQLAKRVVTDFETMESGGSGNTATSASARTASGVSESGNGGGRLATAGAATGSKDFEQVLAAVHQTVYDTMFAGIVSRFEPFAKQDLWSVGASGSATDVANSAGGSASGTSGTGAAMGSEMNAYGSGSGPGSSFVDGDLAMAGLSTSPLRYATEIADYLMAIPQQLEPFVPDDDDDDDDARYATPRSIWQFCKATTATASAGANAANEDDADQDEDEGRMSFAGMWISVLAMGTMELYVEKICSVARLSEAGAKQLATDADYLCSVMGSLGVPPTQDMALVCKLVECKREASAFADAAAEFGDGAHLRKLARRVAAVRGINVTL